MECLFCKIVNKEIPAAFVYEDQFMAAFLDINPVNPGHTLIVPKKHYMNMLDADDQTVAQLAVLSKKIAQAVIDGLGYEAFNLEANNGAIAGQVINHIHWHVVPRKADDGLKHWPGQKYGEGEAEEIARKIEKSIKR